MWKINEIWILDEQFEAEARSIAIAVASTIAEVPVSLMTWGDCLVRLERGGDMPSYRIYKNNNCIAKVFLVKRRNKHIRHNS